MIRISALHPMICIGTAMLSMLLLNGCQVGSVQLSGANALPSPIAGATLGGSVHGGQQPVTGASIQLYAAGTTGYGTGATAVIPALTTGTQYFAGGQPGCVASGSQTCYQGVVTDSTGSFNITGDYTCPSGSSQMYIIASGGNPNGSGINAEISLMAALGPCSSLTSSTFITINEVTTVAAVTALQQFISVSNGTVGAFGIGAPSTTYNGVASAIQGMTNAFATANVLAPVASGTSARVVSTTAGAPTITPESDRIYTLADILASCVNTVDSGGPSSACTTLFGDVMPNSSSVAPSDTLQAMYAIATNPTYNVSNLFQLSIASPPFTPLSSAPNDFSIAVSYEPFYSASGTLSPAIESAYGLAVDAYGNVWSTSENLSSFYAITEIGPTGTLLTGPIQTFSVGGATHTVKTPRYIAIDQSNNAWVTNQADAISGSVAVLPGSSAANAVTATTNATAVGYATGGTSPYALTIDKNNNVFVTNSASGAYNVSEFANAGSTVTTSAVNTAGATPVGIATDTSSSGPFVYVAASTACANSGTISEFNDSISGASPNAVFGDGTPTCAAVTSPIAAAIGEPVGIAVDKNNNLWEVNTVSENGSGIGATYLVTGGTGTIGSTSASSTTFTAGSPTYGFAAPWNVSVDGNNNAWFSMTTGGNAVAALGVSTSTGSPVITPLTGNTGLQHTESNSKFNTSRQAVIDGSGNVWVSNNSSTGIPYLTVVVGVAGPVVTPMSVALKSNRVGQKP
jgi:hypothetical protein